MLFYILILQEGLDGKQPNVSQGLRNVKEDFQIGQKDGVKTKKQPKRRRKKIKIRKSIPVRKTTGGFNR